VDATETSRGAVRGHLSYPGSERGAALSLQLSSEQRHTTASSVRVIL
jgi:hypothetical protein